MERKYDLIGERSQDGPAGGPEQAATQRGGGGGGGGRAFDGGQEPPRVMNFSASCFRRVTRTRTGVRKQVVADICSARGPGCPSCPPRPPSLAERPPHIPPPPSRQRRRREPGCWIVSRCRRETENESESGFFLFFFFFYGLTFGAGGPATPKVERGWTQLRRRTCPRHK